MLAFQNVIARLMRYDNTLDMRIDALFAAINLLRFMFGEGHVSDSSDLEYDGGMSEDDSLSSDAVLVYFSGSGQDVDEDYNFVRCNRR